MQAASAASTSWRTAGPAGRDPSASAPGASCTIPSGPRRPTRPRRLGGLRKRKEGTLAVAYDLEGLDSVAGIRRVLDITITDALGLENGVARLRVLIAAAGAATRLLETGELEARLAALEAAVGRDAGVDRERSLLEERATLGSPSGS